MVPQRAQKGFDQTLICIAQSSYETTSEPLSGTSGSKALATSGRKLKSLQNSSYFIVATQFDKKIKTLLSDNGEEYVNHDLHNFLHQYGIVHQTTCAYTPQHNGVVERKNHRHLEVVRASLFQARMPHHFWREALCSAAYLINRTPSSTLQYQTPSQTLSTLLTMPSTPNLKPRLFGCVAYVQVYSHQRGKLNPCALRCVFVG
ncbi:hypothetical protein L3X38_019030 [Prunus dulcis]|uniref:Integrase catalytic domain-containing protein n=1 Tax=Prunus dulcis TaxID=3755 RepID=A0AAD4ZC60_PRUDU|nr:hypothetical protein L3X38_019030 [Prunus dulcis]